MADLGCIKQNRMKIVLRALIIIMTVGIIIYSQSDSLQRRHTSLSDSWYSSETDTSESVLRTEIRPNSVNVRNISKAYLDPDDWRTVVDDVLYVYSAHVDPRAIEYSVIRIFGIVSQREMSRPEARYYCHVYVEDNDDEVYVIPAERYGIGEHESSRYRMIELACNFSGNPWSIPRMLVSITTELRAETKNLLPVRQNYRNGFRTNFTLCLDGVLKHGTNKSSQLVEWIELNRILGAEHVFVYNFSGSSLLDPILRYYQKNNYMTVLPWSLPIQFREDEDEFDHDFLIVWNYAQRTMIHDCLYRNLYVARHLVYLDLDEFIIPQDADVWTWREMMERAGRNCSNNVASYLARNGIFEINDTYPGDDKIGAITATFTTMQARIREAPARTKYIIIPERIEYLNVHDVERYRDQSDSTCVLAPSTGHVHHYKVLNKNKDKRSNFAAVKFKNALMSRMQRVYDNLKL